MRRKLFDDENQSVLPSDIDVFIEVLEDWIEKYEEGETVCAKDRTYKVGDRYYNFEDLRRHIIVKEQDQFITALKKWIHEVENSVEFHRRLIGGENKRIYSCNDQIIPGNTCITLPIE